MRTTMHILVLLCRICCPYGGLSSVPVIFGFAAFFFSLVSFYGCDTFFSTSYEDPEENISIGYFTIEESTYKQNATILEHAFQRCVTYPDSALFMVDDDTLWIFLRRIITAQTFVGIFILAFLCVMGCNCCSVIFPRKYVIVFSAIVIIYAQSHLLLLAGMKSDICTELVCEPGFGAYCTGFATILWAFVGCTVCCMREKTYPQQASHQRNNQQQRKQRLNTIPQLASESVSTRQEPRRVRNPATRTMEESSVSTASSSGDPSRPQYPMSPLLREATTSASVSTAATSVMSGRANLGMEQSPFPHTIEEPIATFITTIDHV